MNTQFIGNWSNLSCRKWGQSSSALLFAVSVSRLLQRVFLSICFNTFLFAHKIHLWYISYLLYWFGLIFFPNSRIKPTYKSIGENEHVFCFRSQSLHLLKPRFWISGVGGPRGGGGHVKAKPRLPHAPHHPPLCLLRPQEDQDLSRVKGWWRNDPARPFYFLFAPLSFILNL